MPKPPVMRNMKSLLYPFRVNVVRVVDDMKALGFDPWVFETWRSGERADWLVAQNRLASGRNSMHCYGLAADIICRERHWDNPLFFEALGNVAKDRGLTWGGSDFGPNIYDGPHIQAIPVSLQPIVRGCETERERYMFAAGYLSAVT